MAVPGIKSAKGYVSVLYIITGICHYYNITPEELGKNTRKRETVQARQIAMYFCKNHTKSSLATIGREIGKKDHATVLYACKTVRNLMDTDKEYKEQILEIKKRLRV